MESISGPPSVIAKLMGLEDLPSQHSSQKQCRVLSEEYFQRVASIAVREKRSDEKVARKNFVNADVSRKSYDITENFPDTLRCHLNWGSEACTPGEGALEGRYKEEDSFAQKFASLRYNEGHHADSGDEKGPLSCQRYNFCHEVESFAPKPRVSKEKGDEIVMDLRRRIGHSGLVGADIRNSDSSTRESQLLMPYFLSTSDRKKRNQSLTSSPEEPYMARKVERRISKTWKSTKENQEVGWAGGSRTIGETVSTHKCNVMFRNFNGSAPGNHTGRFGAVENLTSFSVISARDCWKTGRLGKSPTSRSSLPSIMFASPRTRKKSGCSWSKGHEFSHDVVRSRSREKDFNWKDSSKLRNSVSRRNNSRFLHALNRGGCVSAQEKNNAFSLEPKVILQELKNESDKLFFSGDSKQNFVALKSPMAEDIDFFSNLSENSIQQDMSTEFTEEDSMAVCCSSIEAVSFKSLEDVDQPSPDSVLEHEEVPFSSSADLFVACSDGTGSGDGHNMEWPSQISKEREDLTRSFAVQESSDFHYIVDILIEAGLHGTNLATGLHKWHSLECPISPSVFQALEKRYGEQKSWKRSERRLLFDQINFFLTKFLHSFLGVPAQGIPVSTRIRSSLTRDAIEEVLCEFLVRQVRQLRKESIEQLLENDFKSLDLGDCSDSILVEIERLVIDELVAEVISL
ncbi:uncharacterized protein LOC115726552 isoform X2 [Rhodamnia argentea]|uniref:Uncharacterized protein LOC115726552 isoform X2 n=1 Tax=Rhodamnia argentea TaxID=178133 RepID=A0A8B8MRQ9_9MYRT|nr:uncharacterized protein LOC115726552 isoform X2 [Rhodamnia argentea]